MKYEGFHDLRNSFVAGFISPDCRPSNKMVKDELSVRMVNSHVNFINTGNLELSGGR